MALPVTELNTTVINGVKYVSVVRELPIWLDFWFAVSIVLVLGLIVFGFYHWFRIYLRSRLLVVIHMPDSTRQVHAYRNFVGDNFKIKSHEKDVDGKPIEHTYHFRSECLEIGFFGRYIEYDYGILEPLNPRQRMTLNKNLIELFKFVSAMLNTDLAVDLLLSGKFKDFVKLFLIIAVIGIGILIILSGSNTWMLMHQSNVCTLGWDNQTSEVIRSAVGTTISRR